MVLLLDYIRLTSPRITLLVMLTGFIGMWIGSRGVLELSEVLWFLTAIALASGGASVFNNYYDRDIDSLMKRTSQRPLACGRLNPHHALVLGILLSLVAFGIFFTFLNALSAMLAVSAIFGYSYIYTVVLKRTTPKATEIGGISGALPPVIGWAAAKGSLSIEAFILFAIMFLWQPPHFWSLGLRYKKDYQNAHIPTMSVVYSETDTTIRSLIYVLLLIAISTLPFLTGMTGYVYFIISSLLGAIYVSFYGVALITKKDINRQLFFYSIIYLSIIFISMVLDLKK
jgi:protoheme IX farnesyltransferase